MSTFSSTRYAFPGRAPIFTNLASLRAKDRPAPGFGGQVVPGYAGFEQNAGENLSVNQTFTSGKTKAALRRRRQQKFESLPKRIGYEQLHGRILHGILKTNLQDHHAAARVPTTLFFHYVRTLKAKSPCEMNPAQSFSTIVSNHRFETASRIMNTIQSLTGDTLYSFNGPINCADLTHARLVLANLRNADLETANLSDADLTDADLEGAHLLEARLSRAILRRAKLAGIDLMRSDLSGADLSYATGENPNFIGAKFYAATLYGVDFYWAHLSGTSLQSADLRNAKLVGVSLRKANADDADLRGCYIGPDNLRGKANLDYASVRGADLRGANFEDATCDGTVFVNAKFSDTSKLPASVNPRDAGMIYMADETVVS